MNQLHRSPRRQPRVRRHGVAAIFGSRCRGAHPLQRRCERLCCGRRRPWSEEQQRTGKPLHCGAIRVERRYRGAPWQVRVRANTSRRQSTGVFTDVLVQPGSAAHLEWRIVDSALCVGRLLVASRSAGRAARRHHGGRIRSATFAEGLVGRAFKLSRLTKLPAHHSASK